MGAFLHHIKRWSTAPFQRERSSVGIPANGMSLYDATLYIYRRYCWHTAFNSFSFIRRHIFLKKKKKKKKKNKQQKVERDDLLEIPIFLGCYIKKTGRTCL